MNSFDLNTLSWLNGLAGHSAILDKVVAIFTNYSPVLFGLLFLVYYLPQTRDRQRMRRTIITAGVAGVIALATVAVIAHFVYRPRPFLVLPNQIHLLVPHSADSSFPSDHATGSAAFAVGMWHAPDRSARWLFTLVAILVGLSRLIAGVHWPTDVLLSFVLGGIITQLVYALARPLRPQLDALVTLIDRVLNRLLHRH
ncbi:MAG: phosphatase PAP2 family protein [Mycobacterium leprae]